MKIAKLFAVAIFLMSTAGHAESFEKIGRDKYGNTCKYTIVLDMSGKVQGIQLSATAFSWQAGSNDWVAAGDVNYLDPNSFAQAGFNPWELWGTNHLDMNRSQGLVTLKIGIEIQGSLKDPTEVSSKQEMITLAFVSMAGQQMDCKFTPAQ